MGAINSTKPANESVIRSPVVPGLQVVLLVAAFAALVVLKRNSLLSGTLDHYISLRNTPSDLREQIEQVVVVPVAALVVVFFRLTLGLRMLGPFRPILNAAAFLSVRVKWLVRSFGDAIAALWAWHFFIANQLHYGGIRMPAERAPAIA